MSLPLFFNPLHAALQEVQIDEILQTNATSQQYGLVLTAPEAREIIAARNQALRSYGRLELDTAAARRIIQCFSASPFITQEDYAATLEELQEIFYYLKNETADRLGDDELIALLRDSFDNDCGGALELLKGMALDSVAGRFKRPSQIVPGLLEGEDGPW